MAIDIQHSFNPRTYIRYDGSGPYMWFGSYWFQSTYLYKVRPYNEIVYRIPYSFNPRTYIRYDISGLAADDVLIVSIHVPI